MRDWRLIWLDLNQAEDDQAALVRTDWDAEDGHPHGPCDSYKELIDSVSAFQYCFRCGYSKQEHTI